MLKYSNLKSLLIYSLVCFLSCVHNWKSKVKTINFRVLSGISRTVNIDPKKNRRKGLTSTYSTLFKASVLRPCEICPWPDAMYNTWSRECCSMYNNLVLWSSVHPPFRHCDSLTRTIWHCNELTKKCFHFIRQPPNCSAWPLKSRSKCLLWHFDQWVGTTENLAIFCSA
jgi:hypothetical protein